VANVLVIHKDGAERRAWRAHVETQGHRTLGAPTLLQGLTALSSMDIGGLVVDLTCVQDVDILRYVASVRDLPPLIVVTDADSDLPPLPARARAASSVPRHMVREELRRIVGDLQHACALGEPPPARHPFRLPPEGVRKWCVVIRGDDPDEGTIPGNEFAA
jgi:hypothetical protein